MKKTTIVLLLLNLNFSANSQATEDTLKTIITRFFDGMQKSDTVLLKPILHKDAILLSINNRKNGIHKDQEKVSDFYIAISKPLPEKWEERILNFTFLLDEMMATVWTEYDFFYKGELSHTGVNQFTFSKNKGSDDWIIVSIIDTRYPKGVGDITRTKQMDQEINILDTLLDQWHRAAAKADEKSFFNLMSDSCIYKGTDKTERWTKAEFYGFAKPFFDKGKAWDFKPLERHIRFDDNMNVAWFDEKLDTWMGICKASGILQKENGVWKLVLYDLSVTIDNDKIKSFIELAGVKK